LQAFTDTLADEKADDIVADYAREHIHEIVSGPEGRRSALPTRKFLVRGCQYPRQPRVFMPYAGGVGAYRDVCDDVEAKGYAGFALTSRREIAASNA
jgi:cyclohexanone monooxygenase